MSEVDKIKIILVDQDGVLADQHGYFLELIKERRPDIYETFHGEFLSYEIEKAFAPEHADSINALRLEKGFFANIPLIAGAKEGLTHLKELGYDVRICTAPTLEHQFCVPEKLAWIDEHLGREFTGRTILTRDKTLVRGDILIDDKPNIVGIYTPTWKHVIYDQPYNKHKDTQPRITWDNYGILLKP